MSKLPAHLDGRRLALATLNKSERAFMNQWGDIPALPMTAKRAPLLGSFKATTMEKAILAGLAVTTVALAAALFFLPHYVELAAYTWSGERYVAGSGDTCQDAFIEAELPSDWREIRCESKVGF